MVEDERVTKGHFEGELWAVTDFIKYFYLT